MQFQTFNPYVHSQPTVQYPGNFRQVSMQQPQFSHVQIGPRPVVQMVNKHMQRFKDVESMYVSKNVFRHKFMVHIKPNLKLWQEPSCICFPRAEYFFEMCMILYEWVLSWPLDGFTVYTYIHQASDNPLLLALGIAYGIVSILNMIRLYSEKRKSDAWINEDSVSVCFVHRTVFQRQIFNNFPHFLFFYAVRRRLRCKDNIILALVCSIKEWKSIVISSLFLIIGGLTWYFFTQSYVAAIFILLVVKAVFLGLRELRLMISILAYPFARIYISCQYTSNFTMTDFVKFKIDKRIKKVLIEGENFLNPERSLTMPMKSSNPMLEMSLLQKNNSGPSDGPSPYPGSPSSPPPGPRNQSGLFTNPLITTQNLINTNSHLPGPSQNVEAPPPSYNDAQNSNILNNNNPNEVIVNVAPSAPLLIVNPSQAAMINTQNQSISSDQRNYQDNNMVSNHQRVSSNNNNNNQRSSLVPINKKPSLISTLSKSSIQSSHVNALLLMNNLNNGPNSGSSLSIPNRELSVHSSLQESDGKAKAEKVDEALNKENAEIIGQPQSQSQSQSQPLPLPEPLPQSQVQPQEDPQREGEGERDQGQGQAQKERKEGEGDLIIVPSDNVSLHHKVDSAVPKFVYSLDDPIENENDSSAAIPLNPVIPLNRLSSINSVASLPVVPKYVYNLDEDYESPEAEEHELPRINSNPSAPAQEPTPVQDPVQNPVSVPTPDPIVVAASGPAAGDPGNSDFDGVFIANPLLSNLEQ